METVFQRWLFASKILSWPKIFVSTILGIGMGIDAGTGFNSQPIDKDGAFWIRLIISLLFTISLLLFIVFMNDYADREVDRIKRKMFPRQSLKTIPDGILNDIQLRNAGILFMGMGLLLVFVMYSLSNSALLLLLGISCFLFFCAYSLPPIRLNYRGGGEFLEACGVSLALPYLVYHWISGSYGFSDYIFIYCGYFALASSSAIASGLSDEESDRVGGKSTFVTRFGNRNARILISICVFAGMAIFSILPFRDGELIRDWIVGVVLLWMVFFWNRLNVFLKRATTNQFLEQKELKKNLHYLIWGSMFILSLDLMI